MSDLFADQKHDPATAVPVVVLTGFLGAGKTTVINHLLRTQHGLRLAVLVNEFGALGIDMKLIVGASAAVIELANGCICCAAAGDLTRSVNQLIQSAQALDGIIIETSGLADPEPLVAALEQGRFARALRLTGVVTVVDALNYDDNLDRAQAAFQQLIAADLVLINKSDLVSADVPRLIEQSVARINPDARTIACLNGQIPHTLILDLPQRRVATAAHPVHAHTGDFQSVTLTTDAPLVPERFDEWLDNLPRNIYRVKGFIRFHGQCGPLLFQLVGRRRVVEPTSRSDCARGASLVLIGQKIACQDFQTSLERCTY